MQSSTLPVIAAMIAGLTLSAPASAGRLFHYDRDQQPVSGDCEALAAQLGPEGVWHGFYSGKRYDDFSDNYSPYAARGCFATEAACRVWQNQAMTYSERGPTYLTSCRLGRRG